MLLLLRLGLQRHLQWLSHPLWPYVSPKTKRSPTAIWDIFQKVQTKIGQLIWTPPPPLDFIRPGFRSLSENLIYKRFLANFGWSNWWPHLLRLGCGLTLGSLLHLGAGALENPGPLYCNATYTCPIVSWSARIFSQNVHWNLKIPL